MIAAYPEIADGTTAKYANDGKERFYGDCWMGACVLARAEAKHTRDGRFKDTRLQNLSVPEMHTIKAANIGTHRLFLD